MARPHPDSPFSPFKPTIYEADFDFFTGLQEDRLNPLSPSSSKTPQNTLLDEQNQQLQHEKQQLMEEVKRLQKEAIAKKISADGREKEFFELKKTLTSLQSEIKTTKHQYLQEKRKNESLQEKLTAKEADNEKLLQNLREQEQLAAQTKISLQQQILKSSQTTPTPEPQVFRHLEHQIEVLKQENLNLQQTLNYQTTQNKKRRIEFDAQEEESAQDLITKQLATENEQLKRTLETYQNYEKLIPLIQENLENQLNSEDTVAALKADNHLLTLQNANVKLLEQRVTELSLLCEEQEAKILANNQLQQELDKMKRQSEELSNTLGALTEFQSPIKARLSIQNLREANKALIIEKGELQRTIAELKPQLQQALNNVKIAENWNQTLSAQLEELKTINQNLTISNNTLELDKKSLSALQEHETGQANADATGLLQELQAAAAQKSETIEKLQQELKDITAVKIELESANRSLDNEIKRLANDNSAMLQKIGRGEYDPLTTKVMHLIENPSFLAKQKIMNEKISELEEKNKALELERDTIQNTEGEMRQLKLIPLRLQQEAAAMRLKHEEQIAAIEEKLRASEKSKQRFNEVFDKKFTEFKKVMKLIFGFRIELTGEKANVYKLFPNGDPGKESYFFLKSDGRQISILDNDYIHQWEPEMVQYLEGYKSFPAFMAAVVLSLAQGKKPNDPQ